MWVFYSAREKEPLGYLTRLSWWKKESIKIRGWVCSPKVKFLTPTDVSESNIFLYSISYTMADVFEVHYHNNRTGFVKN